MTERILIELAGLLALGIAAQWLAWRLRLPSILLLLLCGILAGPVTGFIDPDRLFGPVLTPLVSLSVAIILFEGGLSLRIADLRRIGSVVLRLVSVGALVSGVVITGAAWLTTGLNFPLCLLLGALLVVTGPTVIGPLLRLVRPKDPVGSILKWEGIVIDPIGAILAILVMKGVFASDTQHAARLIAEGVGLTLVVGVGAGAAGAALLLLLLQRYWVPDFLQSAVSLIGVLGAFTISDSLYPGSGLVTVTFMGIALANQKRISIRHIVEFKENLRVLLLAVLFILLAARLRITDLTQGLPGDLGFLALVIFVARPAAVLVSTLWSTLTWKERLFLAWMAPRGIVAASVSSVFALQMQALGHPQADRLVPLTFLVIIGTVTLYGLTDAPVARWLGLAKQEPQGVLLVGAHSWAQEIARTLQSEGCAVRLVDTNRANVAAARLAGLPAYYGNVLSERTVEGLDLDAIGHLLALTANDEVNALAALHFIEMFDRAHVYQLAPAQTESKSKEMHSPLHLHGRYLFAEDVTFQTLSDRFAAGAALKATALTAEFDYSAYRRRYGAKAVPLFLLTETRELRVFSPDNPLTPKPGQTLIGLVTPSAAPQAQEPETDPAYSAR